MSFWSQTKVFSKEKRNQTSTTNGRKNAETACPKTNSTNDNHNKNNTPMQNNMSITIFLRSASRTTTRTKVVELLRQRAWDCPLLVFAVTGFLPFFTRFSRCFTWFFVTFRLCYKNKFFLGVQTVRGPQECICVKLVIFGQLAPRLYYLCL